MRLASWEARTDQGTREIEVPVQHRLLCLSAAAPGRAAHLQFLKTPV